MGALAAGQHGVVAHWQLRRAGLGRGWIEHKLRIGWFRPVFRGVYAVGTPAIGVTGRAMAAVLACGPGACLSHWWAVRHWGLLERAPAAVDVSMIGNRAGQRGIRSHRVKALHESECTDHEGIPITTVPRTLLDLAAVASERQLRRATNQAARRDWLDRRVIAELCERHKGRKGMPAFRAIVDEALPGVGRTRSDLEAIFLRLCRKHGLPKPDMNTKIEGFEVDVHFPGTRLIVEIDSYEFHRTPIEFAKDRRRDAALKLKEYEVLRIHDEWLVTDPAGVAATVRAVLARLAAQSGWRPA